MKVAVVGGSGTIGKAIVQALKHQGANVVSIGHSQGDLCVDVTQHSSIVSMYQQLGPIDALVSAPGGSMPFKPLCEMQLEDYFKGISGKLMGQIDLVLTGQKFLNEGGSFTLTSGILSHELVAGGSCVALVNRAIEGFVSHASLEMSPTLRLNAVSPKLLQSSQKKFEKLLIGFDPVPDDLVAQYYLKSVYGILNGSILRM